MRASLATLSSLVQAAFLILTPPPREASSADEKAFLASVGHRLADQRRAAILLGTLAWISFLYWDIHHALSAPFMEPFLTPLVGLRLLGLLVLLVAAWLSLRPSFITHEQYASILILTGNAACALFTGIPVIFLPQPFDAMYAAGIMLNITFAFSVLRLLARPTFFQMVVLGLISVACLYAGYVGKVDIPGHDPTPLLKLASLIVVFLITGYCVGNLTERSLRDAFQRERQLLQQNRQLAERHQEIVRLNEAMATTSQELTRKTAALEQAQVTLKQTTEQQIRDKSLFLATAVHDLRQPIQAISSALEPARRSLDAGKPDAARELLGLASEASRIMREQLSAILEISWLESGYTTAQIRPIPLIKLLEPITTQTELTFSGAPRMRFEATLPQGQHLQVDSDEEFLSRILLNIISNGLRHRRHIESQTSFVALRVIAHDDHVLIEIEDNGKGIEQPHLDNGDIFRHFWQHPRATKNAENGVGLGLSIVKAMVQQLPGHELSVRSVVGQGSTFVLRLPLTQAAVEDAPRPSLEHETSAEWISPLGGRYILFFEDDDLVRRAIAATLTSQGALCDSFSGLQQYQAVEDRLDRTPDLVLADHQLDVDQTARDVYTRVVARFDAVPLIVLTGAPIELSLYSDIARCSVLRKPTATPDLIAAIVRAITPSGARSV